jgi:predicted nucleotidyltransferase
MKIKKKKPSHLKIPKFLDEMLSSNVFGIFLRSWLSQGFFYMIPLERGVKLLQTFLIFGLFIVVFKYFNFPLNIFTISFILITTQTINWFFSGQFFVLLTYVGYKIDFKNVEKYLRQVKRICLNSGVVKSALLYGSYSRGSFSPTSDIDLRIIPKEKKSVQAALITAYLRIHSFFKKMPLDVFLFENEKMLDQMNSKETPIDLLD